MKVAVLYNEPDREKDNPDSRDVLEQVSMVNGALRALGHECEKIPVPSSGEAWEFPFLFLSSLRRFAPDAVFNLVEEIGADTRLHPLAAGLLEAAGYHFTGGGWSALFATTDKRVAKAMMAANGIPTSPWVSYPEDKNRKQKLAFPVIIKPACEDASIGITDESIVPDERSLLKALPSIYKRLGRKPLLIEQFIDGREFNVSIIGRHENPEVLPPAEMLFKNWPSAGGKPRIVNYAAKWQPDAFEYQNTVRTFSLKFKKDDTKTKTLEEIKRICLACWEAFGLSGYARVDLRLDKENRPFVMEVNSNPCISPGSGFLSAARRAGYTKKDAVRMIIEAALSDRTESKVKPKKRFRPVFIRKKIKSGRNDGFKSPSPQLSFRKSPVPEDKKTLEKLLAGTRAFQRHEVRVALELLDDRLEMGEKSEYMFLFAETGGRMAGYVCYGPITMTRGRFDLYWIAVEAGMRHRGAGSVLLRKAEAEMEALGAKYVYVETASKEKYLPTRQFYLKNNYTMVARVPEYYARGDDKLIFMKRIGK